MSAEAIIKAQARDTLKGNYIRAVSALLIVLLPFFIIDGTTTVLSVILSKATSDLTLTNILVYSIGYPVEIIGFFLFSPVINGYIRAYYRASYTKDMDMSDVFFYFSKGRYGYALALNTQYIIRMFFPALLFYLPLLLYIIVFNNINADFTESVLYYDIYFLLSVLGTGLTIIFSLRYLTAFTITVENDTIAPNQAFEYARQIRRNSQGSPAKLFLSFIPWMLLCLLILPMLYVIPYITQSLCISAKWKTKATFEVN